MTFLRMLHTRPRQLPTPWVRKPGRFAGRPYAAVLLSDGLSAALLVSFFVTIATNKFLLA
jgi:hypothetical protein